MIVYNLSMPLDVIIGRNASDLKKFGNRGTILIGKQYVTMGRNTSLSNNIYLDVAGAHVVFICGKRGGGKSYTMGAIAEGFYLLEKEVKQNLSVILLDTMGIYWTMKYGNKKDKELLEMWGLKPQGIPVEIFTPHAFYQKFKDEGIPTDHPFSLDPSEVDQDDWCNAFHKDKYSPEGVLISKVILKLKKIGKKYSIKDIISEVQKDTKSENNVKNAVESMFNMADNWGVFSDKGTPLSKLACAGKITVLDVSCYATMPGGWDVKSLIVGIVGQHLFVQRMIQRKMEEYKQISNALNYFSEDTGSEAQKMPLVWLVIDEAHEFLPREGKVASTDALVTIMREGRQPGISLILATQQPGKIHTDVMTQSDTVLSHRITAELDVKALSVLSAGSAGGIIDAMVTLPRVKGSAVLFDDTNERITPMRIRPRYTWHGGGSPIAVPEKKIYFQEDKNKK